MSLAFQAATVVLLIALLRGRIFSHVGALMVIAADGAGATHSPGDAASGGLVSR